jgi:hypothetical protein
MTGQGDELQAVVHMRQEVADRIRAMPGGLISDQQEVFVREELKQVVQVP